MDLPIVPGIPSLQELAKPVTVPQEEFVEGQRRETQEERDARRLSARLPPGYKPQSGADMSFDPRIAYEIALGVEKASLVFDKYGLSEAQMVALVRSPAFLMTIKKYKEEIQASGISFKLKAKIQAEDLLTHSYLIATDVEAPMAVRADMIKWTAKVAGLEPTPDKGQSNSGGTFELNITFAGEKPMIEGRLIEGTAVAE